MKPAQLGSPRHASDPQGDEATQHAASNGDMWKDLFRAASVPVGQLGRISAPNGRHLFSAPDPTAPAASGVIPFDGLVHVERRTTQQDISQRWVYVIGNGAAGFCEERYVAIDPPEPTATLRLVSKGDTLVKIAAEAYGSSFSSGNDARLYVQALYVANKGRPGIRLDEADLGVLQTALRGTEEQETLKIYYGVKVIAGQSLWIPSEAFVQQLKASGSITSGQSVASPVWADAKKRMQVNPELANQTGITLGLLDGSYEAIRDLYKGNLTLFESAVTLERDAFAQFLPSAQIAAEKLLAFIEHFPSIDKLAAAIGSYAAGRWQSTDQFGRAEFVGEIVGYIAMNAVLVVASGSESIAAELAEGGSDLSRLALAILKAVDDGANPVTYIKPLVKGIKVPDELIVQVQRDETVAQHVAEDATKTNDNPPSGAGHRESEIPRNTKRESTSTAKIPRFFSSLRVILKDRVYEGTEAEILRAFSEADAAGLGLRRVRDPETGVWHVSVDGHEIDLQVRNDSPQVTRKKHASDPDREYQFNDQRPGPLTDRENPGMADPAHGFYGGAYDEILLERDMLLYRIGSDGEGTRWGVGRWYTDKPIESEAKFRIDTAVKPYWVGQDGTVATEEGATRAKSPAQVSITVRAPKGTVVYRGPVAPQSDIHLGGPDQIQYYVSDPKKLKVESIRKFDKEGRPSASSVRVKGGDE